MAICSSSCFEFLWVTVFEIFSLLSKPLHSQDTPSTPSSCSCCSSRDDLPSLAPSKLKMPMAEAPENTSNSSELVVEVDPTGRYGRYNELIGEGSMKSVYRAFDKEEGIEVAWNQVNLKKVQMIHMLYSEIELLGRLNNENIIKLFKAWRVKEKNTLNFITELCTSGNLREYRKKHKNVSKHAMKKWCKQILKGLEYLHNHQPCVIHRDLNCSNVFVNGNIGQVKIGDLGLATTVGENHLADSVLGTPEFMAPELYKFENYTESIDIYAFGMCLLEMVTMEIPYSECTTIAQIMDKVIAKTGWVPPDALNRVEDPDFKAIIVRCLAAQANTRPSASQLLRDQFFLGIV